MRKTNVYLVCFVWAVSMEFLIVGCARIPATTSGGAYAYGGENGFGFGVGNGAPGVPANWERVVGGIIGGAVGGRGLSWPWIVCIEKGPCYKKKLTCPKKCFKFAGKWGPRGGGGGGGGGGGCIMDCKKKCSAYC